MKNKVLKIITATAALCVGIMFGSTSVKAANGGGEIISISPGTVYENPNSGLKEYCPNASEFNVQLRNNTYLVTGITVACTEDYDAIMFPGIFTSSGTTYPAVYDIEAFRVASQLGKGVIIQNGATVNALEDNLQIPYIRFDEGSVLTTSDHAFRGWDKLTKVEGLIDAVQYESGNRATGFGYTFSGCSSLTSMTLDFEGHRVNIDNIFSGCDKLKTVVIKNATIDTISNMAVRDDDSYSASTGVNIYPMDITFEDITFPENDGTAYLNEAFNTISGKITFKNCVAGSSRLIDFSGSFRNSKAIKTKTTQVAAYNKNCTEAKGSYNGGNIEIIGASAYATTDMFNGAVYGVITLNDFVTEDTVDSIRMFYGVNAVDINGIDTWELGTTRVTDMFTKAKMFYDYEIEDEDQIDYLSGLIEDIKQVDFSRVLAADRFLCFANDWFIADYSGLNLSGIGTFTPLESSGSFYTADTHPRAYRVPWERAYYQTEDDLTKCGGHKLTMILGASGNVVQGADLGRNTLIVGSAANVRVINSISGDVDDWNVISGYKLNEYLNDSREYFSDTNCTTKANLQQTVAEGSVVTVYVQDDGFEEDVDGGLSFSFGTTTNNVNCQYEGSSQTVRLIDYNPVVHIHAEDSPEEFVLPTEGKQKSACQFYEVSITMTDRGAEKKVLKITQPMNITVPLPDDYDGEGVTVLHWNQGLNQTPEVMRATVNSAGTAATFRISSFSHVAVLWNEAEEIDQDITVKWVDDGDYRRRSSIDFTWTAEYEDGLTDTGKIEYRSDSVAETVLPLSIKETIAGKDFVALNVAYDIKATIAHEPSWDNTTRTLTLTYDDQMVKEPRTVKINFDDMADEDYRSYVTKVRMVTLTIHCEYEDGSATDQTERKSLATNYKSYDISYDLVTVNSNGSPLARYSYQINMPEGEYFADVDYDNDIYNVTIEKDVYDDYQKYTISASPEGWSLKDLEKSFAAVYTITAKFGAKEWTDTVSIPMVKSSNSAGYYYSLDIPGSCNGEPRTSLEVSPDPVEGYIFDEIEIIGTSIVSKIRLDKPDEPEEPQTYAKTISVTFIGDTATNRPDSVSVTLHCPDGSTVTRQVTINKSTTTTRQTVEVPMDGSYSITGATGFHEDYALSYQELNLIATWTGAPPEQPKVYKQTFQLNISDKNNEDGSRPEKVTLTVTDGKGDTRTLEKDLISKSNLAEWTIEVNDETAWTITKVEGFPDRYKIVISNNNATAEYTPETMTKTVSIKWDGDADNKDSTRPTSVVVFLKNGDTQVANSTLDPNTNWTANLEVNKYVKGVEASYTLDCADVSNYSKSIDGDTITFKFTGTLSQAAQEAEAAKLTEATTIEGTPITGTITEVKEPDYSFENFDWIDYANRYPDLKRAYGYNKQQLYAHYIRYGIAEGRRATFTGKYATVNEDVLAAYFPDDYKYAYVEGTSEQTTSETTAQSTETEVEVDVSTLSENAQLAAKYPRMKLTLKMDDSGNQVMDDNGYPVYIDEDGNEISVDENGRAIRVDADGYRIYLDENGDEIQIDYDAADEEIESASVVTATPMSDDSGSEDKYPKVKLTLKQNEDGSIAMDENGYPVYVDENGNEISVDDFGNPIRIDSDGYRVYLDENGNVIDTTMDSSTSTVLNADGTITERVTSEDGTVTEIIKDADGNVISTQQYKTGDTRGVTSKMFIILGVLMLLAAAFIGAQTLRNKKVS